MNLRHFLTQGLALLLLVGLSVGFGGCKPEEGTETDPAPANGDADTTDDEAGIDETPDGTDTGTNGTTPGTNDGGADTPTQDPTQDPMGDETDPTPPPPLESGSATDDGNADAEIPSVPEAGSVTEEPADRIPGTPSTPEGGSSTR